MGVERLSLRGLGDRRVDPTDIAVWSAIDDVDVIVSGVAEHEDGGAVADRLGYDPIVDSATIAGE